VLAAPFADVLDRLIDARPGPSTTAATASILTEPILAGSPVRRFAGSQVHWWAAAQWPRPRRRLTAGQREALECLRHAGANLADDFLLSELKSQFRMLARRLHPDMHPDAAEHERHFLAVEFAAVREAYDALQQPRSS
jgi:hypothetical protein